MVIGGGVGDGVIVACTVGAGDGACDSTGAGVGVSGATVTTGAGSC
jgi:hypothetical protein